MQTWKHMCRHAVRDPSIPRHTHLETQEGTETRGVQRHVSSLVGSGLPPSCTLRKPRPPQTLFLRLLHPQQGEGQDTP